MKRTILFTIIYLLLISSGINAQTQSDTVWTKDLWKFGDDITQVEFTPDGKNIAVAIGRGVYIIDKLTGQFVKQFNKYMTSCNSFVIFDDLNWLVTTSDGNRIIIWDYLTTDTVRIYNNNFTLYSIKRYGENSIIGISNALKWNIDSSGIDVFDLNTGEIVKRQRPINSNLSYVYSLLEISKPKNLIALQSANEVNNTNYVELFDLETLEPIQTLAPNVKFINDLAFSNDGKYLASAGSDGLIKVWDLETKTLLKTLAFDETLQNATVRNIQFSPNVGFLVAGGGVFGNYSTKIYQIPTFDPVYIYNYGATHGIDITNDSSLIAIGYITKLILLTAHWLPSEVSISQENNEQELYPNPSGNSIKIPIEKNKIPISISIHSIAGNKVKEIEQFKFPDNNIEIDISDLLQGVYIVTVIYEGKSKSYKFEKMN